MTVGRTEVEGTAYGCDDELNCPERTHGSENSAVFIENSVDSDNMRS